MKIDRNKININYFIHSRFPSVISVNFFNFKARSNSSSILPNILNPGYVPNVGKQPNGNDSGKYKISQNKSRIGSV